MMIVENLDVDFADIDKMDNRLHFVSLTSNMKRAHKIKEGTRLCEQETLQNWTVTT